MADSNPVLCRCLAVSQAEVIDAIALTGAESVRDVTECTGAGRGCLSCHRKIRDLIQQRTGSCSVSLPSSAGLQA